MIKNFKKLEIWKRSCRLVKMTYNATKGFPSEERFGLTSQMRRAAVSAPSNIAEGCGRKSNADFCRFLDISLGSLCELETQFYLSCDLEFLTKQEMNALVSETEQVRKMIAAYQNKMR